MTQWKVLVSVSMGLAFASGILIGMGHPKQLEPQPATATSQHASPPPAGEGPMVRELNLSADQREQIKKIWSGVMEGGPRAFERRQQVEQEYRDKAVALFTPEQKAEYEKLDADYEKSLAAIDAERDEHFRKAIDETKGLLNDDQKKTYGEILTRRVPPPGAAPEGKGPPMLFAPGEKHQPGDEHCPPGS